CLQAYSAPFTF
nr:immunoglobulin light chain junction region [Macaca mulatta]MOW52905.1 immunoglobulin light chain junction region [Macaca mulatta]MOW54586.1 immunoglobulin light chain junction region [Macaca mulatta]MOW54620.1 immunoglobulin light chain junction region [Macaca mulatta]MOW54967.1 immunoglobulin light chain junction region [Macaca mulatta]